MIQFIVCFILISLLPTQLLGQQRENVYLSFDETYVSKFDSAAKSLEYDIYGITRDVIREYVNKARLGDTPEGNISEPVKTEFRQLFNEQADIALDYEDPVQLVSPQAYINRASNRFQNTLIPLIVDAVSIASIQTINRGEQYLVHLNMTKKRKYAPQDEDIRLKMKISIEGDIGQNASAQILSIAQGFWKKEEREQWSSFHLFSVMGGKSIFPQGEVHSGFDVNNTRTAGLSYTFVYPTSVFNGRFALVGGLQGKLSRFNTTAAPGSVLSNSGTPNELRIEFLNVGSEKMDIWSGEGLFGFDYAFSKSNNNKSGFIAAATYRISSISNGNFTGEIEYSEIWDGEVVVRNVINCGLSSFEGDQAVEAIFQGSGATFNRNLGLLLRPYYQFGKNWFRWRIAVEAQYMIGNAFHAGEPIFLKPIQETINSGETQVQYGNTSLIQSASSNLSELYLGLHLSYWLPVQKFQKEEKKNLNPSPFSKEKLDDFDGKGYLILNGDISDAEAAARIQKELGPATQFVWIINTTELENVIIPDITELLEVRMENNEKLQHLSFPQLQEVYDIVRIEKNDNLQEFHAPALKKLYEFEFRENSNCHSIQFPQLHSSGNEFLVSENNRLEELQLPNLESAIGDFVVSENQILKSVKLPGLNTIEGGLSINLNPEIHSIHLPILERIEGSCNISTNATLGRLAIPNLQRVKNGLSIIGNEYLRDIRMPQLHSVAKFLDISSNQSLQNIYFPVLTNIGSEFTLRMNTKLHEVNWPELARIEESLNLNGLDSLHKATYPKLTYVGENISVSHNKQLKELQLPELVKIEQGLLLSGNSSLDSLHLPKLEQAEIIAMEDNEALISFKSPELSVLSGYSTPDLRYSGSGLWVSENSRIRKLHFPKLREIRGKLYFNRNHKLESLTLPVLEFTDGDFIIRHHKNLLSLTFPQLDTVSGDLNIYLNDQLTHIALPELVHIGGSLRIQNNPDLRSLQITTLERIKGDINASFNALRSRDINQILSIPARSQQRDVKTIILHGQIPKAPPYGIGQRHKDLLQRTGNEVTTD